MMCLIHEISDGGSSGVEAGGQGDKETRRQGDKENRRKGGPLFGSSVPLSPCLLVPLSPFCPLVALSCFLLLAAATGCSTQQKVTYEPVNHIPIVGDDAMALRADWPRSVARYQNGTVVAYSTRAPYTTKETQSDTSDLFLEPLMFVLQSVALPLELVANPPGQPELNYGIQYQPTYTAQPVLPPPGGVKPASGWLYGPGRPVGKLE
jgi:hypothetical protein